MYLPWLKQDLNFWGQSLTCSRNGLEACLVAKVQPHQPPGPGPPNLRSQFGQNKTQSQFQQNRTCCTPSSGRRARKGSRSARRKILWLWGATSSRSTPRRWAQTPSLWWISRGTRSHYQRMNLEQSGATYPGVKMNKASEKGGGSYILLVSDLFGDKRCSYMDSSIPPHTNGSPLYESPSFPLLCWLENVNTGLD